MYLVTWQLLTWKKNDACFIIQKPVRFTACLSGNSPIILPNFLLYILGIVVNIHFSRMNPSYPHFKSSYKTIIIIFSSRGSNLWKIINLSKVSCASQAVISFNCSTCIYSPGTLIGQLLGLLHLLQETEIVTYGCQNAQQMQAGSFFFYEFLVVEAPCHK